MPITSVEMRAVIDAGLAYKQTLDSIVSLIHRLQQPNAVPEGVDALAIILSNIRDHRPEEFHLGVLIRADARYTPAHLKQNATDRVKKLRYKLRAEQENEDYVEHHKKYSHTSIAAPGAQYGAGTQHLLDQIDAAGAALKAQQSVAAQHSREDWDAYNAAKAAQPPPPKPESETEMKARLTAQLDKQEADIELRHQAMLRRAAEFEAESNTILAAHVSPSEPTKEQIAEFLAKKEPGPVTRLPQTQEEREALERQQVTNIKLDL